MLNSKVPFIVMTIWLWLHNVRKGHGLTCDTGMPPLWESSITRCMFYFSWNCSESKGEKSLLKQWKKGDDDIAFSRRNSNFTTNDGYHGRLEQYNENGFIFRDVKSKDAGYYTFVLTINNTNEVIISSHIFLPSIPSCDPNQTVIYKDSLTNGFPCDRGQIPIFIGLVSAFGITTILLTVLIIYLCCRYKMSNNDSRPSDHDSGGDIKLLSRTS
ncbi:hypothetical protein ACJMK2_024430 [Sinanodonta woodiana]|uniref:Uncharacterized protein n=1 Tax=Sinanodonta woodiana TaxID=1069815 RepID=A0ABD3XDD1_SINWO